jgi:hypothetical protein
MRVMVPAGMRHVLLLLLLLLLLRAIVVPRRAAFVWQLWHGRRLERLAVLVDQQRLALDLRRDGLAKDLARDVGRAVPRAHRDRHDQPRGLVPLHRAALEHCPDVVRRNRTLQPSVACQLWVHGGAVPNRKGVQEPAADLKVF